MIERKALIGEREFIEVNFKDLPDEPRQRTEKYHKQLRLPRALYLSIFFGSYRPWGWELTPGESVWTLNQEPPQGGPPCDAGTAYNPTSENTDLHEFVNPLQATSVPPVLNQQEVESSISDGDRGNCTTSQGSAETEPQHGTSSHESASIQHQVDYKQSSGQATSINKSGKWQRQFGVENDSS